MKKIISLSVLCCLSLCFLLQLSSCGKNGDIGGENSTGDETLVEPQTNEENRAITINETEAQKAGDLPFYFMLLQNYDCTCNDLTFSQNETLSYQAVFPYFLKSGCYNSYTKDRRPELSSCYDKEKKQYSIPAKTVDDFLESHFNVTADSALIDCYNKKTDCYELKERVFEYYYEQELLYLSYGVDNTVTLDVVKRSAHDTEGTTFPQRMRYIMQVTGENYRFLSVEKLDAVQIINEFSGQALTNHYGTVMLETADATQRNQYWWIVTMGDGSSSIRPVADGYDALTEVSDTEYYVTPCKAGCSLSQLFSLSEIDGERLQIADQNGKQLAGTDNMISLSDENSTWKQIIHQVS